MTPSSEQERLLVREELAAILCSVHFAHSKRYPALLNYVVQKTLEGHAGDLKERTLGVEVFHRRPDYDSSDDTIVRVTAGEVRKRLALVYHESDVEHAIQIELPAGSYVPEFFRSSLEDAPPLSVSIDLAAGEYVPVATPVPLPKIGVVSLRSLVLALLTVGAAVSLGYVVHARSIMRDSLHSFWAPVRTAATPVLLAPGAMVFSSANDSHVMKAQKSDEYPYISVSTADALSDIGDMFAENKINYAIQPASAITLKDMREHPVVLVGAYNNEWSLRLLGGLRFRFADEPNLQIYDSLHPSVVWTRPPQVAYKDADDFAIVARFRNKLTENFVVVIGGIGKSGTEAAAQFVTSNKYLDLLDRPEAKDWATKNVELVIRTKVIDGNAGPPTIESIYVW